MTPSSGRRLPADEHPAPYRYEVTITVVLAAGSMDKAMAVGTALYNRVVEHPDVLSGRCEHPVHRNDLDGALG